MIEYLITDKQIDEIRDRCKRDADKTVAEMDNENIHQMNLDRALLLEAVDELKAWEWLYKRHDESMMNALTRIVELEKERDAAMEDLKDVSNCDTCIHYTNDGREEPCRTCHGEQLSRWEWRGPKET